MSDELQKVSHIEEIDTALWYGDKSGEVNDYLDIDDWILVAAGSRASTGDDGSYSSIVYSVGWVGEGDPQIPPARPR